MFGVKQSEEQQILTAQVDPLEWKQEVDRVYVELANITKEVQLIVSRKGGGISKFMADEDEDIEECRRHIELIIEECGEIKKAST
jgi:hypothetical protein